MLVDECQPLERYYGPRLNGGTKLKVKTRVPPEPLSTKLHGVTSQSTILLIVNTVRNLNFARAQLINLNIEQSGKYDSSATRCVL